MASHPNARTVSDFTLIIREVKLMVRAKNKGDVSHTVALGP